MMDVSVLKNRLRAIEKIPNHEWEDSLNERKRK